MSNLNERKSIFQKKVLTSIKNKLTYNNKRSILLNLVTGCGKTRLSLLLIQILKDHYKLNDQLNILIVHNLVRHKDSFIEEIEKLKSLNDENVPDFDSLNVTFSTYRSLSKLDNKYDIVILDECHHVTDKNHSYLINLSDIYILLSASIPADKMLLINRFIDVPTLIDIKVSYKKAIELGLFNKPTFHTRVLQLDDSNSYLDYIYRKNKSIKVNRKVNYDPKTFKNEINTYGNLTFICTELEYYKILEFQIDTYYSLAINSKNHKVQNIYRKYLLNRKKFLNFIKSKYLEELIPKLKNNNKRFILFTYNINYCNYYKELFDITPVTSNNNSNDNLKIIKSFNNREINSISSVVMLNESMNLKDIDINIIATTDLSWVNNIQKIGRSSRSENPNIVLFAIKYTRDWDYFTKIKNAFPEVCFKYYYNNFK